MLFDTLEFFVFLIFVILVFYHVRTHKQKLVTLLLASYFFYFYWRPEYIFLLMFSTGVDYLCSLKLAHESDQSSRKRYMLISIFCNLSILFYFKYTNFFVESINALKQGNVIPTLNLALPIGLSFYTFQSMGYTLDVYRREIKPERDPLRFALFVSYFPQLVAGPIEKAGKLLPQLFEFVPFCAKRASSGARLIGMGLFKKIVLGDGLSMIVDPAFANPTTEHSGVVLAACFCFTFQIWLDFSGYTDVAIGVSRIFGIKITDNFNRPFYAKSFSDLWRRFHITLFEWLKENVYNPLKPRNWNKLTYQRNLMIVFLASGLWHGASIGFIIWGGINGTVVLLEHYTKNIRHKIYGLLNIDPQGKVVDIMFAPLLVVVNSLALISFRAETLEKTKIIFAKYFYFVIYGDWFNYDILVRLGIYTKGKERFIAIFASFLAYVVYNYFEKKIDLDDILERRHFILRWSGYFVFAAFIIIFGNFFGDRFAYTEF